MAVRCSVERAGWWWVTLAFAGGLIATLAALPAPELSLSQPGSGIAVDPPQAAVFSWVTVSGQGCVGPSPYVQVELTDGYDPRRNAGLVGMYAAQPPAADGSWAFAFKVSPLLSSSETYVWRAFCTPDSHAPLPPGASPDRWSYADAPFQVTNGPQAGWQISAGDSPVLLEASGFGCIDRDASVNVWLTGTTERNYDSTFGSGSARPDANGAWSLTVTIDTAALGYQPGMPLAARAVCVGEQGIYYPPFTVTAPADVRRAPANVSFTG